MLIIAIEPDGRQPLNVELAESGWLRPGKQDQPRVSKISAVEERF